MSARVRKPRKRFRDIQDSSRDHGYPMPTDTITSYAPLIAVFIGLVLVGFAIWKSLSW